MNQEKEFYRVVFSYEEIKLVWDALNDYRLNHSENIETIELSNTAFGAMNYILTGEGHETYGRRGFREGELLISGKHPVTKLERKSDPEPPDFVA